MLGLACRDEAPRPPPGEADAGPSCELGTRNCACIGGSRCSGGLLCIVGLCSARSEPEPSEMPPRPRPRPPLPDPGDPDANPSLDAGAVDANVSRASEADAGSG